MLNNFVLYKNLKRHFSFYDAAGIMASFLFLKNKIHIPSIKTTIFLRPGTKDKETFNEIFRDNLYGIPLPFSPGVIIDAGANTGIASVFFKTKYPGVKIAAVEIESSNADMIRKNLKCGPGFFIYQKALYNKKAFFKVEDPFNATNSFVIREVAQGEGYDIGSITIDEIMQEQNWDNVDILKIDIEGAEKILFESGYQSWLPKIKVVMIETHDRMVPDCAITVLKAMQEFGFTLFTTTQGTLIFFSKEIMKYY